MNHLELLRKAILVEGSQAAVAAKLKYSPATISRVLAGNYDGDMAAIFSAIATTYGGRTMEQTPAIPDGYMQNSLGHLVPIESIKEVDLLRDEVVRAVVRGASDLAALVREFKTRVAGDVTAFLNLSSEKYGVEIGGNKGNVTLTTFDGRYKVVREIAERLDFDERLQAAKALIDECMREWTKDSGVELKILIDDAFQVDKRGRINTKRILSLRRHKIEHPTWMKAMEAISEAVQVTGSWIYYRVYERGENGVYRQVSLDFSAA